MPGCLDNRDREGQSAMSLAQLRGSTSLPNSPGNRTPPHLEKTDESAKDRNQKLLLGMEDCQVIIYQGTVSLYNLVAIHKIVDVRIDRYV